MTTLDLTLTDAELVASVRALPDAELVALVLAKLTSDVPCGHCGFTLNGTSTKRGMRPKLTAELQAAIVAQVEAGNYLDVAAMAAAGVDQKTLERWRREAQDGREPYAAFFHEVDCARARAQVALLAELREAGNDPVGARRGGAGRHIEWLLERRFRERFGPQIKVELENAKEKLLDVCRRVLAPEVFEMVLAELELDGAELPIEARLGAA